MLPTPIWPVSYTHLGHLQATGSEIAEKDYSERTVIGGLECVSPEAFSEQIAYTALGHIDVYKRQCEMCSDSEHVFTF